MAANIIEPPKQSYSEIVATPQRNVRKSQNIHNPKPTSFTAQTGQHFRPPKELLVDTSPKVLITSSQEVHDTTRQSTPAADIISAHDHPYSQAPIQADDTIQIEEPPPIPTDVPPPTESLQCNICFRKCKSVTGLKLHAKKCRSERAKQLAPNKSQPIQQQ